MRILPSVRGRRLGGRRLAVLRVHQTNVAHVQARVQFEYFTVVGEVRRVFIGQPVQHLQVAHHGYIDRVRFHVAHSDQAGQRVYGDVADVQTRHFIVGRHFGRQACKLLFYAYTREQRV